MMDRLPFDPDRAAGARPATPSPAPDSDPRDRHPGAARHLSVTELNTLIRRALDSLPSPLRVMGEISNFGGRDHWYFCLKDEASVIACVAFASDNRRFGFVPREGDEVVAVGEVGHYGQSGKTQFYVKRLIPVGDGALQARFRALCDDLRRLGYFDDRRKRRLPLLPRRVAVITSADGAALQDVISTARQRCCSVGLLVVHTRVQGEGAALDVVRALRWVDAHRQRLRVDAILITRGGGSIEDLWAFNERCVADAVLHCALPVVAAIGHESDTTIIELVADLRAATPTQAAMHLVPSAADLRQQVEHLEHRLHLLSRRLLDQAQHRLKMMAGHEAFREPAALLRRARQKCDAARRDLTLVVRSRIAHERARLERLDNRLARQRPQQLVAARHERLAVLSHRLEQAICRRVAQRPALNLLRTRLTVATRHRLRDADRSLHSLRGRLTAVDPTEVLNRGFSYTMDAAGKVLKSVSEVQPGEGIVTQLADGRIRSTVSGEGNADQSAQLSAPIEKRGRPPRRRNPQRSDVPQMDLFSGNQ